MATNKNKTKVSETKKTAVKSTSKTATKTKVKPELTEEKVRDMIESAFSRFNEGLDKVMETLKANKEAKPEEITIEPEIPDIPEPPLPDLPPVPEDPDVEDTDSKVPFEEKPTVEVSPRSLGGVIAEQGVSWNMFLVSILMALVLGAIFASMYFLNRAIQLAPLEIQVPEELEYQETTRIDTGLDGSAMVYSIEGRPFSWCFKRGVLIIKPQAEGTYSLMVTIASGRKVRTGYVKFESMIDAGDTRYRSLTDEVKTAIECTIPESERGFCKEIGDNYKQVSFAKPESLDSFGEMIRDKNRETLGFNNPVAKLDNESNWYNLLKNGGPISDLILRYAGVDPSKETLAKISMAISRGFYAVKG